MALKTTFYVYLSLYYFQIVLVHYKISSIFSINFDFRSIAPRARRDPFNQGEDCAVLFVRCCCCCCCCLLWMKTSLWPFSCEWGDYDGALMFNDTFRSDPIRFGFSINLRECVGVGERARAKDAQNESVGAGSFVRWFSLFSSQEGHSITKRGYSNDYSILSHLFHLQSTTSTWKALNCQTEARSVTEDITAGGAEEARHTSRTTNTPSRCWWRWTRRCRNTTRIRSSRTCWRWCRS